MKIKIEVEHEDKVFKIEKSLTNTEIKNCVFSIKDLLYLVFSEMENEIIKKLLDNFSEHGKEEYRGKIKNKGFSR